MQMDGGLTAIMPITDLRVGDELEMAWTLDEKNPVLGGLSESRQIFSAGPAFGRFALRYSWPNARKVRWSAGPSLPKPLPIKTGHENGITIDVSDYTVPTLPDGAPGRFLQDLVIEASEFASWARVAVMMLPLYAQASKVADGSPIGGEIRRIAALSSDASVRASEALKTVQGTIRYFARTDGLGGYIPESADAVWAARSGDCKGKTVLLLALLRGLGIDADAALVSTGTGDGLDLRLPMPSQFDHVIVRATIAGKVYWLDGTRLGDRGIENIPVPAFKWALPVRAGSEALERLVATDPPLSEAEWTLELDARAGVDKPAKAHGIAIFRGERASALRTAVSLIPPAQRDEFMRKTWLDRHYWIKPDQTTYTYNDRSGEVRLDMSGTGDMDWNNKDGETYNNYEPGRSTMGQNLTWKRPEALQDAAPIHVASRFDVAHETVLLPDGGRGFRLEAEPIDATIAGVRYLRKQSLVGERFELTGITRSREGELTYAQAVAADKATDALSNKRVFLYLPSLNNTDHAAVKSLYKARSVATQPELRGKAARAEYRSGSISNDDYPTAAMRDGTAGTTLIVFDVGIDGRVHDCGIGESSGSVVLDNQSCALVTERFTYTPAKGADGSAKMEARSQRIVWKLPDAPATFNAYDVTYRYTLGTDGIARDCISTGTPKPPAFTVEQCAKAGEGIVMKDKNGLPTTVIVTQHHVQTVEPIVSETSSGNPR